MFSGRINLAVRLCAAAVLFVVALISAFAGGASGGESSEDLEARMDEIQAELDAATARIEDLRSKEDALRQRLSATTARIDLVEGKKRQMMGRVVDAARELYKSGSVGTIEVLMSSEDFGDLAGNVELLSQASQRDQLAFVRFARTQRELTALEDELGETKEALAVTREQLTAEADRLQAKFTSTEAAYKELLVAARKRAAAEAVSSAPAAAPAFVARPSGDMACPVAGPVSFSDTWGAPRSGGRSHQGVDMMASYGTPVAAITSGSITFAGYGSSAGNWQILSGDDGHQYWYMHNQSNIVTGGRVRVGQQIATVGDTGNATGVPHLHFEYHPGGGAAVNPTPLVASVC